jgi:hypothetical protein
VAISDPATAHFTAHKNLGNTRIAYKPRHAHTHTHTHTLTETLEAREKPRWQLVTQLLTDHNTHQMMDKVQKHNSFNTNTPSSESYRNYLEAVKFIFLHDPSSSLSGPNIFLNTLF